MPGTYNGLLLESEKTDRSVLFIQGQHYENLFSRYPYAAAHQPTTALRRGVANFRYQHRGEGRNG